jgi:serine/threonine protein kinase
MLFLGKYESLGVLSRGSMGLVHAARPTEDPATTVVVKVMRSDLADTLRAHQFFDREVRYTARLRHPYVVRILDAGVDPAAGTCIVMEFVPGTTLEQLLKKEKRLSVERTARLTGCLCHALEAAHLAAVIHRDLKPANLMIVNAGTRQEQVKVMDFGLAHLASKPFLTRERLTGAEVVSAQGTPAYISPEQLRGDDVDGRTDLYSAGVVLFETIAGQVPFPQRDLEKLIEAHLYSPPPRFAELGITDVPEAFEAIVRLCLSKFPAERPASPRILADAIGRSIEIDLWKETTPVAQIRNEGAIPLTEDIPPESVEDENVLIRKAEAWMPDRIAVIKLGGFLRDLGAKVVNSQPGLLQARLVPPPPPPKPWRIVKLFKGEPPPPPVVDGIAIDLNLDKPNPAESRLVVTVVFRCPGGGRQRTRSHGPTAARSYSTRCEST